jgi:hypothetical protein
LLIIEMYSSGRAFVLLHTIDPRLSLWVREPAADAMFRNSRAGKSRIIDARCSPPPPAQFSEISITRDSAAHPLAHRELLSAVSAQAGSRAVDGTQAEAVRALCLFRHHRKFQSGSQLPAPGHRRVAEVVEPSLATGRDFVGGNAPAACALSAATAAQRSSTVT